MQEKHIETPRGTVYYFCTKEWNPQKDTIFFFHGLTADHTMFAQQVEYFEGTYNVIAWDAPGHGKSRPYKDFTFEDTTDDIMKILEKEKIHTIIAIGQSLGGYYIQALMKRHPEVVKAFVGIGTTPYGEKYYSRADKFWLRQVEWMCMCYPFEAMKHAASKQATVTECGFENMMAMLQSFTKKEYAHLMGTAYKAFLADNCDLQIKCPVLITRGDNDKAGKVKQYCDMWSQQTGYSYVVIKNAGHNANVDNAGEMNRVIEDFLK